MKAPLAILLNVIIVAVGIFLYDALREGDAPDAPRATPETDEAGAGAQLGDPEQARLWKRMSALEERVGEQGRQIGALRDALKKQTAGTTEVGGSLLEPLDETPGGAGFDERTLKALEVHMVELQRRRREEQRRQLVERNLDKLGLALEPDQREAVVEAIRTYQRRTQTFWADMQAQGINDRKAQLAELGKLREVLAAELRNHVPERDVARALDGLIGRASLVQPPDDPVPDKPKR